MTEPRRFPFGGVPVYNPQSLSKGEALAQFHAREAAYLGLMDILREERASHVLIIGTRGMGKTTLLQRVRYGVEDDAELNNRYLALAFPEEQYNVNRLHHFLLNTVDALADAMERMNDARMLAQVEEYAAVVGKRTPEEIEQQVPKFLAEIGQQLQKSFLLLVDNADRLFETIEDRQQWRLRELLSSRHDLTFFGATTQASDGIYGPERAFFEFFQIQRLAPLTFKEVRNLLVKLSESVEEKEGEWGSAKKRVAEWLEADAPRLETLVQLTGGNPRTTVLLFHLVLDGLAGGAREYLEQLLDQVTPNYKGRVDELPAQAQQVLDGVALKWDPVTAMEVAGETGLETTAVSTQLTRLVRQGILEKADPGDSKKALYQVSERFFNIWYLMRASRRVRAKLRWFVEFLRVFFESAELEKIAWERIERYRSTWRGHPEEIDTAFAYVVASGARRDRVENYLRQKCADMEEMWLPYLDLIECPMMDETSSSEQPEKEARPENKNDNQIDTEARVRKAIEGEPKNAAHWRELGRVLSQVPDYAGEAEAAYRKAIELDPTVAGYWSNLGYLLAKMPERTVDAEMAYRKAIELDPNTAGYWHNLGYLLSKVTSRSADAETAYRRALDLNPKLAGCWRNLGYLLAKMPERSAEAEMAYRRAIEQDPNLVGCWHNLGHFLAQIPERITEAETAFRKAIELDPNAAGYWHSLGYLLAKIPGRIVEAETAYRRALELNPNLASCWGNLGSSLAQMPERTAEAETAYRRALELDPKLVSGWTKLGSLLANMPGRIADAEAAYRNAINLDSTLAGTLNRLGDLLALTPERTADAEIAYRKAIELDPTFAGSWNGLGDLLAQEPARTADAEAAYRKAIELDPTFAGSWIRLGDVLTKTHERTTDAEAAYRKAIELDPTFAGSWNRLGDLLSEISERTAEAETAYLKAIDLDPKDGWFWHDLADLLEKTPERWEEAEAAYRKAIELDPEFADSWNDLGILLEKMPVRIADAEAAYRRAIEIEPKEAVYWSNFAVFLACQVGKPKDAEIAFRNSLRLRPDDSRTVRNLGVLLYCDMAEPKEATACLGRAHQLDRGDPISAAIFAASLRDSETADAQLPIFIDAARQAGFWNGLLDLCRNYPPFGKILLGICDLVQARDNTNRFTKLYRAVALAQLKDFPRASVGLDDALAGDPIELLSIGKEAIETFLAAAVTRERVHDCLDLLDKKDWKDAWRPIYEALRAVEEGSADYLKRIAVEIRQPAMLILRRIAPQLPGLPERIT